MQTMFLSFVAIAVISTPVFCGLVDPVATNENAELVRVVRSPCAETIKKRLIQTITPMIEDYLVQLMSGQISPESMDAIIELLTTSMSSRSARAAGSASSQKINGFVQKILQNMIDKEVSKMDPSQVLDQQTMISKVNQYISTLDNDQLKKLQAILSIALQNNIL